MKTPKDPRHQARRAAISEIYSLLLSDINYPDNNLESSDLIFENLEISNYDEVLFSGITNGVKNSFNDLIKIIESNSGEWEVEKFYKPDLAVLLSSVWELKNNSAPPKVIVDEAVELAKEFGETDSSKFINGVLAGVISNLN
jgi:N utilization substance protein B